MAVTLDRANELIVALERENKILREQLAILQQGLFGRKTERIDPGQLGLFLKGVEGRGGSFVLASAIWVALGFGFPSSFSRWPKDDVAEATGGALQQVAVPGDQYKDLVALNASVRSTGTQLAVTNDSTQPWEDVKLTIVGVGADQYDFHLDAIGETVNAPITRFMTPKGGRYNPQRGGPARTLVVTAEIGAGGPTGVYAARL